MLELLLCPRELEVTKSSADSNVYHRLIAITTPSSRLSADHSPTWRKRKKEGRKEGGEEEDLQEALECYRRNRLLLMKCTQLINIQ